MQLTCGMVVANDEVRGMGWGHSHRTKMTEEPDYRGDGAVVCVTARPFVTFRLRSPLVLVFSFVTANYRKLFGFHFA